MENQITNAIEVNENAIEPHEYFKVLKGKIVNVNEEELQNSLNYIAEQLISAKKVGQKTFLRKLAFVGDVLMKEQILLQKGIENYVLVDDIKQFLHLVEPKNSVKIIELERYPRAIPLEALKRIEEVKDFSLFDDFCVVFTDFTKQDYKTPEEKEKVKRNRDPIVFGFFKDDQTGYKHDRFYFVTDWEDEFCDLTFSKLIDKISKTGIKNPKKIIGKDHNYLQGLVKDALEETEKEKTQIRKHPWWKQALKEVLKLG